MTRQPAAKFNRSRCPDCGRVFSVAALARGEVRITDGGKIEPDYWEHAVDVDCSKLTLAQIRALVREAKAARPTTLAANGGLTA